ncbi:MAG: hypothetical protein HY744_33365 [Deltaproteobacteria bacterium]|nr:hypothetical protein [Deltaproteobacteria bacterium]
MTCSEATAEVFWQAFRGLPAEQRRQVLMHIVRDRTLRQDIMDAALIEERRHEPTTPFRDYLATRRRA